MKKLIFLSSLVFVATFIYLVQNSTDKQEQQFLFEANYRIDKFNNLIRKSDTLETFLFKNKLSRDNILNFYMDLGKIRSIHCLPQNVDYNRLGQKNFDFNCYVSGEKNSLELKITFNIYQSISVSTIEFERMRYITRRPCSLTYPNSPIINASRLQEKNHIPNYVKFDDISTPIKKVRYMLVLRPISMPKDESSLFFKANKRIVNILGLQMIKPHN